MEERHNTCPKGLYLVIIPVEAKMVTSYGCTAVGREEVEEVEEAEEEDTMGGTTRALSCSSCCWWLLLPPPTFIIVDVP